MEEKQPFAVFSNGAMSMRSESRDEKEIVFSRDSSSGLSPYGVDSPVQCISLRTGMALDLRCFTTDKAWVALRGTVTVADVFGNEVVCSSASAFEFRTGGGCLLTMCPTPDLQLLELTLSETSRVPPSTAMASPLRFSETILPNGRIRCFSGQHYFVTHFISAERWSGGLTAPLPFDRVIARVLVGEFQLEGIEQSTLTLHVDDVFMSERQLPSIDVETNGGSLLLVWLVNHRADKKGGEENTCINFKTGLLAKSLQVASS